MEICRLTPGQEGLFSVFLPEPLPKYDGAVRLLGFHEDGAAYGAAVVGIGILRAEILSVRSAGCPAGTCERALADQMIANAGKTSLQEIVFLEEGTEEELDALEEALAGVGFVAEEGGSACMRTTLGKAAGGKAGQLLMRLAKGKPVVSFDQLPSSAVVRHNAEHPGTPIRPDEFDTGLSRFFLDGPEIRAVLLLAREESGLRIDWMSSYGAPTDAMGWLVGAALQAASDSEPEEAALTLAAGDESARRLAERLGFEPIETDRRVRIFTCYLK